MHIAKKSLGQNFLQSEKALAEIISAGEIVKGETVLEAGPGQGALTWKLLECGANVIAVEKDHDLIPLLSIQFEKQIRSGQLKLVEGDILEFIPSEHNLKKGEYKIIANIPYYITGIFIRHFLEHAAHPSGMVLLVQKEVAERIVSRDEKESMLSLSVKAYGSPKYIATVPAGAFRPAPKIDSAIIAIRNISKDFFSDITEHAFFETLHICFTGKRKQVKGSLKKKGKDETKVIEILERNDLSQKARPEEIPLHVWKELAK